MGNCGSTNEIKNNDNNTNPLINKTKQNEFKQSNNNKGFTYNNKNNNKNRISSVKTNNSLNINQIGDINNYSDIKYFEQTQ